MDVKTPEGDVGVIVGRFQVHKLHGAHRDLIKSVMNRHETTIVFLGVSPVKTTANNPLDFMARKSMLMEAFPNIHVLYIKDRQNDAQWSDALDDQLADLMSPAQTAVLYGSRDSFIRHYHGRHNTAELIPTSFVSGTEIRKNVSKQVLESEAFRAGVIWATNNMYNNPAPTIDVAIIGRDNNDKPDRVLLGCKPDEHRFRFIGGFVDSTDLSHELAGKREVHEETGLEVGVLKYVTSTIIDDWRYRSEQKKIMSILFMADYIFGSPSPQDDIAELRWFPIPKLAVDMATLVVPNHQPMMAKLLAELNK